MAARFTALLSLALAAAVAPLAAQAPPPPPDLPSVAPPPKAPGLDPADDADSEEGIINSDDGAAAPSKIAIRRRAVDYDTFEARERKRRGSDIFGLGLVGFSLVYNSQSLENGTKGGRLDDSNSGTGLGASADIQLAGGRRNSIGIKRSGEWYWRWGMRLNLDYLQTTSTATVNGDKLEENFSYLHLTPVVKYYFPFDEYQFSRRIPVLNRFHAFLGPGLKWTVSVRDLIENKTDRTFEEGPGENDVFFVISAGWNFRITDIVFWTFDFAFSFNMSPGMRDITGREIEGAGTGGSDFILHTGLSYRI